jgi:hypothetical protein
MIVVFLWPFRSDPRALRISFLGHLFVDLGEDTRDFVRSGKGILGEWVSLLMVSEKRVLLLSDLNGRSAVLETPTVSTRSRK